jgi:hypothetical protein
MVRLELKEAQGWWLARSSGVGEVTRVPLESWVASTGGGRECRRRHQQGGRRRLKTTRRWDSPFDEKAKCRIQKQNGLVVH